MPIVPTKGGVKALQNQEIAKRRLAYLAPRLDDTIAETQREFIEYVDRAEALRSKAADMARLVASCNKTLGPKRTAALAAPYIGADAIAKAQAAPMPKPRRARLDSVGEARQALRDLTGDDSLCARYCIRSGAYLGALPDDVVIHLAAILRNERACVSYMATLANRNLLAQHGIAPHWLHTDTRALARLRAVDPAGYATYLAAYWTDGEGEATNTTKLSARIECRARLANDPDLWEKVTIFETLAKIDTGVMRETMAHVIAGKSCAELRNAAARWINAKLKSLPREADAIDGTLSSIARARHLRKLGVTPSNIAAIRAARINERHLQSITLAEQLDIVAIFADAEPDLQDACKLDVVTLAELESAGRVFDKQAYDWAGAASWLDDLDAEAIAYGDYDGSGNDADPDPDAEMFLEEQFWSDTLDDLSETLTSERGEEMAARQAGISRADRLASGASDSVPDWLTMAGDPFGGVV